MQSQEGVPEELHLQDPLALQDLALRMMAMVAGARRARPRGRMGRAELSPHPNASHRPALRGTRARHVLNDNYDTTMKSWRRVNEQGLNWKTG